MLLRGITLSLVAAVAAASFAGSAEADHHKRQRRIIVEDEYYSGPPILRHIPGVRIFFGDYALTEDEFNALYGDDVDPQDFDESYYEPEPNLPRRRGVEEQDLVPRKPTAAKPKPDTQKTAAATAKPKAAGPMSCDKATSVVSGYGFSQVTASSCSGKIYAFNAKRDGKNFAVKLDSGSGELTEVKKLP